MQTTYPDYARLSFAVMLAVVAGGCDAKQRMLDAVVRQSGQLPCFSVTTASLKDKEELTVAGIQVSELDAQERAISATWTAGLASSAPAVRLSPSTCIQYGAPAVEYAGGEAEPLLPGRHYTVFINAHVLRGEKWQNRSYGGYFCLLRNARKEIKVHQVLWDDASGRRLWNVCGGDPLNPTGNR